jgi:plastocyanin
VCFQSESGQSSADLCRADRLLLEVLPIDHFQRSLDNAYRRREPCAECGRVFRVNSTGVQIDQEFFMRISSGVVTLAGMLFLIEGSPREGPPRIRRSSRALETPAGLGGRQKSIARLATLIAAAGLLVGAAGPAAGTRSDPKTHTVTIDGMRFQPERLTVAEGDTVVWINKDLVPHTATSEAGHFDSQIIQTEKSWKFSAEKKGEFPYVCTFHPTMKASLVVE